MTDNDNDRGEAWGSSTGTDADIWGPPGEPPSDDPGLDDEPPNDEHGRRVRLLPASAIKPRPVRWLWTDRIAAGTLTLLAGREGLGKSTIGYWVATQITRGTLPGDQFGRPGAVIVAATEDGWAEVIIPRLMAAGADLDRIYRVDVIRPEGGSPDELTLPRDHAELRARALDVDARLLLLDPLMSRLSPTLDTHKDGEVRQALEPLAAMLEGSGMAAIGLIHLNKSLTNDPMTAIMGSRAFTAVARAVSTVVPDPDDQTGGRRFLGTPKNNLGRTDLPLLSYTIEGLGIDHEVGLLRTSRIVWGDEVDGSSIADQMERTPTTSIERTAVAEAADWLTDYLTDNGGQARHADIHRASRNAGHSDTAVRRARERIRITTSSAPGVFPRATVWHLPEDTPSTGWPERDQ